jgi:hypothetical protein
MRENWGNNLFSLGHYPNGNSFSHKNCYALGGNMLLGWEEVMKTLKFVLCALVVALTVQVAFAESHYLVDDRTGKYLGSLSNDRYHPDSVSNPYGLMAHSTAAIRSITRMDAIRQQPDYNNDLDQGFSFLLIAKKYVHIIRTNHFSHVELWAKIQTSWVQCLNHEFINHAYGQAKIWKDALLKASSV